RSGRDVVVVELRQIGGEVADVERDEAAEVGAVVRLGALAKDCDDRAVLRAVCARTDRVEGHAGAGISPQRAVAVGPEAGRVRRREEGHELGLVVRAGRDVRGGTRGLYEPADGDRQYVAHPADLGARAD